MVVCQFDLIIDLIRFLFDLHQVLHGTSSRSEWSDVLISFAIIGCFLMPQRAIRMSLHHPSSIIPSVLKQHKR